MKRYKLLKDLPTFNAGDEFVLRDNGCLYLNKVDAVTGYLTGVGHWKNDVMAYHKRTLEQFPNILEDWFEEIEEPKEDGLDHIITLIETYSSLDDEYYPKEIVEKLKAFKRLKDKGFRFGGWKRDERFYGDYTIDAQDYTTCDDADLDICFGGEE